MRRTFVGLQMCAALVVATIGMGTLAAKSRPKDQPATSADGRTVCSSAPLSFTEPIVLGNGRGYEPSIEIDSAGTIFVTAHKQSVAAEGSRTASWLWRSADNGVTFENMGGLLNVTEKFYALEGDLAVDGMDRLYFVDTWAADNYAYRYSDNGTTLDFVRPVIASAELDDRPWLAAHGDGFVYYLSNTIFKHDGRLTLHRSTNGGDSFNVNGFTFPDSGWGLIDADPNGPHVYGLFNDMFYGTGLLGNALSIYAWHSPDQGVTWTQSKVADLAHPYNGDGYPTVAVSPRDGSVWALWLDGEHNMMLGQSTDRAATWTVTDITPFAGTYGFAWLDVSNKGDVAVTFSAHALALGEEEDAQRPYAMIVQPGRSCLTDAKRPHSACSEAWGGRYVALQSETAGDQGDFFQVAFAPDNTINVAYTDRDHSTVVKYVRQRGGANLGGRQICGFQGSLTPGAPVQEHPRWPPPEELR